MLGKPRKRDQPAEYLRPLDESSGDSHICQIASNTIKIDLLYHSFRHTFQTYYQQLAREYKLIYYLGMIAPLSFPIG